ncbi:uncharacterized protein LOC129730937 isoform X2 [Wyeomyia smithii]|uniref:uncharacterized protein LOC129730937 isoform X2 n=1 Tax=Wyeomyia smithii TaxID=174621 RepID=UPI0024680A4E|nr:uncharacterized protein LOC129730937 isoform X2 [Wyeomyia smithii]
MARSEYNNVQVNGATDSFRQILVVTDSDVTDNEICDYSTGTNSIRGVEINEKPPDTIMKSNCRITERTKDKNSSQPMIISPMQAIETSEIVKSLQCFETSSNRANAGDYQLMKLPVAKSHNNDTNSKRNNTGAIIAKINVNIQVAQANFLSDSDLETADSHQRSIAQDQSLSDNNNTFIDNDMMIILSNIYGDDWRSAKMISYCKLNSKESSSA